MKRSKLRPMGDITADMELLLLEMVEGHDLQWAEVLGLVHAWLSVHAPGSREEYDDGGHPSYFYGWTERSSYDSGT